MQLAGDFLKDCFINPNPGIEILQRKILIWRMSPTVGQRESEQECFDAENPSKIRNERNAASLPDKHWITIEGVFERVLRRFAVLGVGIGEIPRAGMASCHVKANSRLAIFLEMLLRQCSNFVPSLIRNEAESQLGECFATDHCLGASTLITATETVDLRCRSRPNPLKSGKAFFAK